MSKIALEGTRIFKIITDENMHVQMHSSFYWLRNERGQPKESNPRLCKMKLKKVGVKEDNLLWWFQIEKLHTYLIINQDTIYFFQLQECDTSGPKKD